MLSRLRSFISVPADLIAVYLFTVFHYVRFNEGWPARKFYLTVVFLLALVWELIRLIRSRRLPSLRLDAVSAITLLLGAKIALTAVFSKYGYLAYDPKQLEEGAVIWCVYLIMFLLFRREYVPRKSHFLLLLFSGYIECLLMLLHTFVFTIYGPNCSIYGNYNLLGLGMSVMYALNLLMLATEEDTSVCLIHYILAFFFSLGLIYSRSDNTLLCMAALLGILPFLYRITAELLKKLLRLAAILLLSMAAAQLLTYLPAFDKNNAATCMLLTLSRKLSPLLTTALGLSLFLAETLIPKDRPFPRLTKILRTAVIALLLLAILALLLVNFAGMSFGPADKFLRFDDSWGTGRGRIWRGCLFAFREYTTPLQKLFGTGINSTPFFTWDFIPEQVKTMNSSYYCTPHNFLLQWLMEDGVCGLLLFCLLCFLSWKECRKHNDPLKTLSSAMTAVFLAGWLVTVHSPDITPFFIVFLAVCAAPEKARDSGLTAEPEKTTPA